MNKLIQAMIMVVIGLALLPVVADFASDLTGTGGALADTTMAPLVDLLPLLYVVLIIVGIASYIRFKR